VEPPLPRGVAGSPPAAFPRNRRADLGRRDRTPRAHRLEAVLDGAAHAAHVFGLAEQPQGTVAREHVDGVQLPDQARIGVERPEDHASFVEALDRDLLVGRWCLQTCAFR
jgi:hypothetical protein